MELHEEVWVRAPEKDPNHVWIKARISSKSLFDGTGNDFIAVDGNGRQISFRLEEGCTETADVKKCNSTSALDISNLIDLPFLHEAEMLRSLEERYQGGRLYTLTGPVLIAINPGRAIIEGARRGEEVFDQFLKQILASIRDRETNTVQQRHTIIINGESGSGKTECARMFLRSLLSVSEAERETERDRQEELIVHLLHAGTLLETFGNASLAHSDNSSRFCRCLSLTLSQRGLCLSGLIQSYLLEHIRVVNPPKGQGNFHIFHRLCAVDTESDVQKWQLDRARLSPYLPSVPVSTSAETISLSVVRETLLSIGVTESEIEDIFALIAGILHLGLVSFQSSFEQAVEGVVIVNDRDIDGTGAGDDYSPLHVTAGLFSLNASDLRVALTQRSVNTNRETFQARLKAEQALQVRDALAKVIYKKVFLYLNHRLNEVLGTETERGRKSEGVMTINVLDMFGFDSFAVNGFEQLCINYANETLQQIFNKRIFQLEAMEYEREGITLSEATEYPDNSKSMDVLHSLFKLLDDQCRLPNRSDKRLAQVFQRELAAHSHYSCSVAQQPLNRFSILHYVGRVQYSTESFIAKNTDELTSEASQLLSLSSNRVLQSATERERDREPTKEVAKEKDRDRERRGVTLSAAAQFSLEVKSLLKELSQSEEQHFVRCINPVSRLTQRSSAEDEAATVQQRESVFHQRDVAEQLRYGGILEAMKMSRSGFPHRYSHGDFVRRYEYVVPPTLRHNEGASERDKCLSILSFLSSLSSSSASSSLSLPVSHQRTLTEYRRLNPDNWTFNRETDAAVGLTKVFVKPRAQAFFDFFRQQIVLNAQKRVALFVFHRTKVSLSAFPPRINLSVYRRSVLVMQRVSRGYVARRRYKEERRQKQEAAATALSLSIAEALSPVRPPHPPVEEMKTEEKKMLKKKRSSFFGELTAADSASSSSQSSSDGSTPPDIALASKVAKQARELKNTAAKVTEYKQQDERLLKEINLLIAAKRVSDETALLRFDIPRAKTLLLSWSAVYRDEILQGVTEIAQHMEYGYQLLVPEKLVPSTMLGKMLGFGAGHASSTSANKPVTKDHKVFKRILFLLEMIKSLLEKLQVLRKSLEASSKSPSASSQQRQSDSYQSPLMICYKTVDFLRILHQYYYQYVIHFVEEYGAGSEYRRQFQDDETKYCKELAALISQRKPLLQAEQPLPVATTEGEKSHAQRYGVFPLTLSVDALNPKIAKSHVAAGSVDSVVFRLIHCAPGIEYAVNCLYCMLQQEVVMYPIRFIKLVGKSALNYGQIAFYQAATEFSEETLASLSASPEDYDYLDLKSYSVSFLVSLLCGALRGLPRNYMVTRRAGERGRESWRMVGVINDRDFCPQLFHPQSYDPSTVTTDSADNVLFTCPQLLEPLHPQLRDLLLSHTAIAAEIVSSWLRELYRQNVRYSGLTESGFTESDLARLMVPIRLPQGAAAKVYESLNKIIAVVRSRPSVSHRDILAALYPGVASRYGAVVEEIRVATPDVKRQRLSTMFSLSLHELKEPNEQFTIDQVQLEHLQAPIEEVAAEFLRNVSFVAFTEEKSLAACAQIGDNLSFLPKLSLRRVGEEQLAVMFGVVLHMAWKAKKQKKESFGAKLFTKQIEILGLDAEEKKIVESSIVVQRMHDLLGMAIQFLEVQEEDDEEYGQVLSEDI